MSGAPGDDGYIGPLDQTTETSQFNEIWFLVQQALSLVSTATLVQVKAVTNAGQVSPVGFVDVLPLVNQLDGDGNATTHSTVFHLPYFRLQGGTDAIICDPKVGDIGLASFADRDISSVKANKAQSNPGSLRRFSMSDGLYLGGFLNAQPVQYLRFRKDGIEIVDINGNSLVLKPAGITLTDLFGNVIDTHEDGMTVTDVNKNILDMSPTGITFTDLFGNVLKTTSAGLTWTDIKGNVWASGASGITLTTPLLACTGRVVSGFGGADQVELQTHRHVETAVPGPTAAPTPGT